MRTSAVKRCLALLIAVCLTWVAPAGAQDSLKIAAVVNDDVITMLDLVVRTRIALLASHQEDTPQNRSRLIVPALRNLIDERLKAQAVKAYGIEVSEVDVDAHLRQLAEQNNLTEDEFKSALVSRGVLVDNFTDQIRTEMGWAMLVRQRFHAMAAVSDKDVDDELAQFQSNVGKPEYAVAEIFLPVYGANENAEVRATAQGLMDQLRNGADFGALAREFSQSATAGAGGQLGWNRLDQFDPAIATAVSGMLPGQVTGPIQVPGGYSILMLHERRETAAAPDREKLRQQLSQQRFDRLARGFLLDLRNQAFIDIRLKSDSSSL
jgi:peptidyl-prolyl cis-trans isomerase SurA